MVDTFGAALRSLRQQRGLSLTALAARVSFSKSYLGNVETGDRQPTAALADACDQALGSAPLLATLVSIERGDPMLRRALLGGGLAAAATALTAVDGTTAVAAVLNAGLRTAVGKPADWDGLAADFARRHVLAPCAAFGDELAAHLQIAQTAVARGDRDAARGGALLAMTYGLWIGDTGRIPTAHSLYDTAAALADTSGDPATRALVRARAANRGIYEGWPAGKARTRIAYALQLDDTGAAALEAHAARVHLAALTGDLTEGRRAVDDMHAAAAAMPEAAGPTPQQRVASFHSYLECRAGTIADAERVWPDTERLLAAVPLWRADAQIYMGRALVAAGNIADGAALALDAVTGLPAPVRVLGIGVRDLLTAAGPGHRDPALHALRGYAATGPAPWDTV